jgi:hypothetical protein
MRPRVLTSGHVDQIDPNLPLPDQHGQERCRRPLGDAEPKPNFSGRQCSLARQAAQDVPSSVIVPVSTTTTVPSWGFSFSVSGMRS